MVALKINQEIYKEACSLLENRMRESVEKLHAKTGKGNDFLGWVNLPNTVSEQQMEDMLQTANVLRNNSQCVVVIGIGGSYLGTKALVSALSSDFPRADNPQIIYAGHHLSEDYYVDLLEYLNTVDYSLIVISKSGTTIEPAIAFRLLKKHCENKYGTDKAKERVVCITDKEKGALRTIANQYGYTTYNIADDIGGRFSVLTPVGLLPVAVAGIDIRALLEGAKSMYQQIMTSPNNIASQYAICRNYFLHQGKHIEVLASFEPKMRYFIEWWKQLFGESEGKDGKGIFPAGMIYTTDLHSMGQYMQDGQRMIFETFLSIKNNKKECTVPDDEENTDNLNFLSGEKIGKVNHAAEQATVLAHRHGSVPVVQIIMDSLDEYNLGQLLYFFEYACAVSSYILDVNPFDQPGVEAYKQNMFALLNKPGHEDKHQQIQEDLSKI